MLTFPGLEGLKLNRNFHLLVNGSSPVLLNLWRLIKLLLLLYLFFLSIQLMQDAFKLTGKGFAERLLAVTANPLNGLCIGILATSLVQSSSTTSSILVGLVASGSLSVNNAIPVIMGANIGTTVTCAIVALAHVNRSREFQKAYAAASVHDFFNLLSVMVLLPLEITTHLIEHTSNFLSQSFCGVGGFHFISPVKTLVGPADKVIKNLVSQIAPASTVIQSLVLLGVSFVLLAIALRYLSSTIRQVISGRVERLVNSYLFAKPLRALVLGVFITALVQSSSVSTSLVVPMVAGGIFTLEKVFPFMLGANIGTTVTALMASLVTGSPAALTVAIAHFLFNVGGTIIWYPLRPVPIRLAEGLANIAQQHKTVALAYVLVLFFVIPLVVILL